MAISHTQETAQAVTRHSQRSGIRHTGRQAGRQAARDGEGGPLPRLEGRVSRYAGMIQTLQARFQSPRESIPETPRPTHYRAHLVVHAPSTEKCVSRVQRCLALRRSTHRRQPFPPICSATRKYVWCSGVLEQRRRNGCMNVSRVSACTTGSGTGHRTLWRTPRTPGRSSGSCSECSTPSR